MVMKLRPESDEADVQAFVQQLILIGTYIYIYIYVITHIYSFAVNQVNHQNFDPFLIPKYL